MENNQLCHWGIKGMKWGIRRYQNKDGSLTPAGQKRYNQEMSKTDTGETVEQRRARLLKSVDAKELYENKDILTNEELNARINRIDLEARLKSKIVTENKKSGLDHLNETLNKFTKTYRNIDDAYSAVANSAIGKTLAKKLGLDVPKQKDFDLQDFYKNINKKSNQEVADASKRVINEKQIKKAVEEMNEASKKTKSADTKTEQTKTETFEGTVEGTGTSKSNIKNDTGKTTSTKSDDYYDPIDAYSYETVSSLPVIYTKQGKSYVDEMYGDN